jgi:D-alanine-D-alanine ligase
MEYLQNQPQTKLKVGVIFGGRSGEHEVSLMSAQSVMAALDREKYEVIPLKITRDGRWLDGEIAKALTEGREAVPFDVVIPVLHGPYGEDGTVQGLLELADLPYVGAGVAGSAVGMDKGIFKYVMVANGLPVLPWELVLKRDWLAGETAVLDRIEAALSYPVFTKPANLGSSVGISKCRSRAELKAGLDEAARHDRRIVVEQGINARELEVAVLGNEEPVASIAGEIRPRRDFYDYTAKYLADEDEQSDLLIPAELDEETAVTVRTLALKAYRAIDCGGLGRVDLLLDAGSGGLYLNEINTMPGFTRISMYPKLWEASGLPYPALLDRLIALALDRYEEKSNLQTELVD